MGKDAASLQELAGSTEVTVRGQMAPHASRRPRTMRFSYFLRLFVRFRWAAAASAAITIATTQTILEFQNFAYPWLYTVVAWILLYNTAFYLVLRSKRTTETCNDDPEPKELNRARLAALSQVLLDLLSLFTLLHFAGGLTNPFILFFLFHVVITGILLEARHTIGVALLASALIFALGVLEKVGILTHYRPIEVLGQANPIESWLFVLGLPSVLTITILVLTTLLIFIMNERSRRRDLFIELSRTLDQKNQELIRIDQMRKQLLAVASHDLKSPINAVVTSLISLRDGYLDPLTDKQGNVIERCLLRLGRLREFIDDVLHWTAIERGAMLQEMQPVDLSDILRNTVEDYRESGHSRSIEIKLDLPEKLPLVCCSPERMMQVMANLVSNAVKYSKERANVQVKVNLEEEGILISVSDEGIGISQHDLEHLFDDFFRAPSVKAKVEGTGLGLALVRRIVHAHNGQIWATSELEVGSTFFVRLPLCPKDAPKSAKESMSSDARLLEPQPRISNRNAT